MRIANQISDMIYRLKRANIPFESLCYQLDELEWREFIREIEGFGVYLNRDLTYANDVMFKGIMVRKRPDLRSG